MGDRRVLPARERQGPPRRDDLRPDGHLEHIHHGNTVFRKENTPLEWNAEGRMKLGPKEHCWVGRRHRHPADRRIRRPRPPRRRARGRLRPDPRRRRRPRPTQAGAKNRGARRTKAWPTRDHDGIPDDLDACPNEPEDHKGPDPYDGCPAPARPRRRRHPRQVRQVPRRARGQGRHPRRRRLPRGRRRPRRHPRREGRLPARAGPALARSEEQRLPAVHQARRLDRAHLPAGPLRLQLGDHPA